MKIILLRFRKNMKKNNLLLCLIALFSLILACSKPDSNDPSTDSNTNPDPDTNTGGGTPSLKITIDPTTTYQTIRGFGGCNSVFRGVANFPNEADMQKAFGMGNDELGLSIFRISVPKTNGTWADVAKVAKFAKDRGAIVFATPWDAPDNLLDPTSTSKRVILPTKYGDYVNHLNSFVDYMINQNTELYAISIQNEPDIGEWTKWTTAEIFNFTKNFAGNLKGRVISAESFNFNRNYYTDILNDPTATANIDIVGGHIYGNGLGEISLAEQNNKEIWMTEYLLNLDSGNVGARPWKDYSESDKWNESLKMLTSIHNSMTSNWNAYIWWYLKRYYSFIGDGEEGTVNGEVLKRGIAFSHFSKFVRPGFVRIANSLPTTSPFKVTTYKKGNQTIVVFINSESYSLPNVQLTGLNPTSATSYTTSLSLSMDKKDLTITNKNISVAIKPYSVTTVVIND